MNRRRNAEHVGAVTGQCGHQRVRSGQLGADRGASVPAQRAATGREHGSGAGAADVIGDRSEVGHAFTHDERVRSDRFADARGQILRSQLGLRLFRARQGSSTLRMSLRVVGNALGLGALIQLYGFQVRVELLERRGGVGAVNLLRVDVPQRHLLLQWIHIDVDDACRRRGVVDQWYPRNIAVDDQHHVRFRERFTLVFLVPLGSLVQGIIRREVDGTRHRFKHTCPEAMGKPHEFIHCGDVAPQIRRDHERPPRSCESGGHPRNAVRRQCG